MNVLSEAEVQALNEALDDEYRAYATYSKVIADFGEVPPFIHIREAEARHIHSLSVLFEKYGLSLPENTWPGKLGSYPSLRAACEAGVQAEIANGAMYDRLLAATDRSDIVTVFQRLREASQERHLPAFTRCAQRPGGGRGTGPGRGTDRGGGAGRGRRGQP